MDTNDKDKIITDKIKKITEATYRITDLYHDREPLKWVLREMSLGIYNDLMSVMSDRNFRNFSNITKTISNIANILELASLGGFISDINFGILKREYITLKSLLENQKETTLIEQKNSTLVIKKSIGHSNGHNGHNERKQRIMDLLGKEEKMTIKEMMADFSDISEKSVQRDLSGLVKSGELKAEGEKRWRTYSLN